MKCKASEATIHTVAVEIKALTISGKQMTLAVFKQLKSENLIDTETGQLRGVPWGVVNYHNGCVSKDHLHVIWQLGDELRQSVEYRVPARPLHASYYDEAAIEDVACSSLQVS